MVERKWKGEPIVGKKTSIRRDCDSVDFHVIPLYFKVGKKTSIRRDCDHFRD